MMDLSKELSEGRIIITFLKGEMQEMAYLPDSQSVGVKEMYNLIGKAIQNGDIKVTKILSDGTEEIINERSICSICGKNDIEDYAYYFDFESEDINEQTFCSKKCRDEFILREAKKIKQEEINLVMDDID